MTTQSFAMGIDPSTVATGWAVLDASGKLTASGTIRHTGDIESRILATAWDCGQLYAQYRPLGVWCEEQILSRLPRRKLSLPAGASLADARQLLAGSDETTNVKVALDLRGLSRAIGFCVHICSAKSLQVTYLRPATWRAAFSCAKASKVVALHQIKILLRSRGIPFADLSEDETEAVGVCEAGRLLMMRSKLVSRAAAK